MIRISALVASLVFAATAPAIAQVKNYKPVTQEMLLNPSPNDWLMYSRTYDAWRYSPLKQINKKNVKQLRIAWVHGLAGRHRNDSDRPRRRDVCDRAGRIVTRSTPPTAI